MSPVRVFGRAVGIVRRSFGVLQLKGYKNYGKGQEIGRESRSADQLPNSQRWDNVSGLPVVYSGCGIFGDMHLNKGKYVSRN